MGKWLITIFFLIASAMLTHWLPFSSFFRNVDTMIHEFGHALATLLLSGNVLYIYLFEDHSGVTLSAVQSGWRLIPVALSGYIFASLFAVYLFSVYRRGKQSHGLWVITLIAIICLTLFIRNPFGVIWTVGLIALNFIALFILPGFLQKVYFLFIAFLCLEESVSGPISLWIYALDDPANAGDSSSLAQVTGINAPIWAFGFTIFSLWCAKRAIQSFLGSRKKQGYRSNQTYGHEYEG